MIELEVIDLEDVASKKIVSFDESIVADYKNKLVEVLSETFDAVAKLDENNAVYLDDKLTWVALPPDNLLSRLVFYAGDNKSTFLQELTNSLVQTIKDTRTIIG